MKRLIVLALSLVVLMSMLPISVAHAHASSFLPTLTKLNPAEGSPGQEVRVEGMGYRSGTKIAFFTAPDTLQKETRKARLSATPVGKLPKGGISTPPGMKLNWMEFKFRIPDLEPGTYFLRLEISKWFSEPLAFTVLPKPPVITSISPSRGDTSRALTIRGRDFGTENFIKLTPVSGGEEILIIPYSSTTRQLNFYPWLESWPDVPTGRYKVTVVSRKNGQWLTTTAKKEFTFVNNKPQELMAPGAIFLAVPFG